MSKLKLSLLSAGAIVAMSVAATAADLPAPQFLIQSCPPATGPASTSASAEGTEASTTTWASAPRRWAKSSALAVLVAKADCSPSKADTTSR